VRDQVSHQYTTGKITVLYVLFFKFLERRLKDKRFCAQRQQIFSEFNLLLISWMEFWFVIFVPKYYEPHMQAKHSCESMLHYCLDK
jgi:hypothetical protein